LNEIESNELKRNGEFEIFADAPWNFVIPDDCRKVYDRFLGKNDYDATIKN